MSAIQFKIADQHLPILAAVQSPEFKIVLVIGERSTGKSTDATGAVALGVLGNIQKYIETKQTFAAAIMRQNAGDKLKTTVWRAFSNRIIELQETQEIKQYSELQETSLKGREVGQVWAFCKGFQNANKSDTAGVKGLEKVNIYVIDEAEEIAQADFDQLLFTAIREKATVILVCNTPHKDHWITRRFLNLLPTKYDGYFDFTRRAVSNFELVRSRLTANPFLSEEVKEIYRDCGNPDSQNYNLEKYCRDVLGLVSSNVKGKIFSNYTTCSQAIFNDIDTPSMWGLDFGFSNDPTAFVEVKIDSGCLYVREHLYETGLTVPQIENKLTQYGINKSWMIAADSGGLGAMIVEQMRQNNWNTVAATKGQGSIKFGIQRIQEYKVFITESSRNILDEFNNYSYLLDQNKEPTPTPQDANNHAIDAIRYAITTINTTNYDRIYV